ncbi:MAG: chromate efflux transporter [Paracoccaceae bacterium]
MTGDRPGIGPSWPDIWREFGRIGVLSFGGPAAQIALMHRVLVDERKWLGEQEYLRALSFCMLLPGPEAMQLATYAGWRLRGIPGGLLAGGLFVLPGAALILVLAALYTRLGGVPFIDALFLGIKACVVVIVIEALLRVSKRALTGRVQGAIASLAFAAIFVLGLPFPLIIAASALAGALLATPAPPAAGPDPGLPRNPTLLPVLFGGFALWALPLAAAWATGQGFLFDIGLFFSKLAIVTFGGAYAVLAYMAQEVVQTYGWVTTPQLMDALGLAETTPGPLILVTEFVGYLAGHARGGPVLAALAAGMVLWVTFVPCFLWIFAFAPYVEWTARKPRLTSALRGITAAVVGVIANLALWFGLHVLFARVGNDGPLALPLPDPASFDLRAAAIALAAGFLLLRLHWPLLCVLGLSAVAGVGLSVLG